MSNTTTKQLYDAVFSALSNDATLKSYIKEFSRKLSVDAAKASFPLIMFSVLDEGIVPRTVGLSGGRDDYEYNFAVDVFVRSLSDDFVITGSATEKGILDIVEDVLAVIQYKKFGNIITCPSRVNRITYGTPRVGDNFLMSAQLDLVCTDLRTR